jgi:hypothetical protein
MHAVPASRPSKKVWTPHGGKLKKKQPPTRPSRLKSWLTAFPCSKALPRGSVKSFCFTSSRALPSRVSE